MKPLNPRDGFDGLNEQISERLEFPEIRHRRNQSMLNDYKTLDARDNYELLPKKRVKSKVNFDDQEVVHKKTYSSI